MDWDKITQAYNRRGYKTYVCKDEAELKQLLSNEILPQKIGVAGFGNSQTCRSLGLIPFVEQRAEKLYIHDPAHYSQQDDRNAQWADWYFASANGVSLDGYIVNIDGTGNRIAATCYGPQNVVYIIGQNKIAQDLNGACERAKQAAVANAKRLNRKTPCVVTGKCEECLSPESICGVTSIHRKALFGNSIWVIFVQQELGL